MSVISKVAFSRMTIAIVEPRIFLIANTTVTTISYHLDSFKHTSSCSKKSHTKDNAQTDHPLLTCRPAYGHVTGRCPSTLRTHYIHKTLHQMYNTHKFTQSTHPLAVGSSMAAHRRRQAGLARTGRIASKGLKYTV